MTDKKFALKKFLLPENEISLKLIFDNVRNYVIIGAFAAMSRWFATGKATAVPGVFTKDPSGTSLSVLAASTLGIGIILFALNIAQSYEMVSRLLDTLFPTKEGANGRPIKRSWYFYVGIVLAALAFMAVFMVIATMLFTLALYMVWFSAVGGGH